MKSDFHHFRSSLSCVVCFFHSSSASSPTPNAVRAGAARPGGVRVQPGPDEASVWRDGRAVQVPHGPVHGEGRQGDGVHRGSQEHGLPRGDQTRGR